MPGCTADGILDNDRFSKPVPWIGLYVTAASILCTLGMSFDAYRGFRDRKLWFPSKYFSLNATTLTLLSIAVKLPVDLTTPMPGRQDQLSKLSGTVLICTIMGNFMPSLGAMDVSEIVSNVLALGILIVTVIVNICIQMSTGVIYVFQYEHTMIIVFMLILFLILASSALIVPTTKQLLEKQFNEKYREHAAGVESIWKSDYYTIESLKKHVENYWMMAHTCSPQYVIGRSATCTASGAFCLIGALILIEAIVRSYVQKSMFCMGGSDYHWSTKSVFVTQVAAAILGTIAPAIRWFTAVSFRRPEVGSWSCKEEFQVEKYWLQRLREWKEAPLHLWIGGRRWRKVSHVSKNLLLVVLLRVQAAVVMASKVVRLASILPVSWVDHGKRLLKKIDSNTSSHNHQNPDPRGFVLHLEGESDLVNLIMRTGRKDTKKWIQRGRKNPPCKLIELLTLYSTKSKGFKGVGEFDSINTTSLVSEEPPNCWALPLVTLTSIAIALPDINPNSNIALLKGVYEGLRYIRLIEKNLDGKALESMRETAEIVWLGVDLYDKWFDIDLHLLAVEGEHGKRIVERLEQIGKECVSQFQERENKGEEYKDPIEWPAKVLAANCMYRVCATILQDYDNKYGTDLDLYFWLRTTISDIMGACLTNLPRAIYMECFCYSVEVREERVRNAALRLGEAEEDILGLANAGVANWLPERNEYIDEWRMKWQIDPNAFSTSSGDSSNANLDQLSIPIVE